MISSCALHRAALAPLLAALLLTAACSDESTPDLTVSSLPDPANYSWEEYVTGLDFPLAVVEPPDETQRLFIVEQPGRIQIAREGELLPQPFLDISEKVTYRGERGLLGLAFHPDYAQNGYLYINYIDGEGNTVIARMQVSQNNPNKVEPGTETVLMKVDQPYANHNGGHLVFGPDGYLYLSLGDGGSAGDPQGNGQSLDTLLGKILRVDIDNGEGYAIPRDNPFAQGGGEPEIWYYGLRNPWRIAFDPHTADMYIADVGQNRWEELNFVPADSTAPKNFGWNFYEGNHPYRDDISGEIPDLVMPVFEYSHSEGCSITGGEVYRGDTLVAWHGVYLFGDYCEGKVWGLLMPQGEDPPGEDWMVELLFDEASLISAFGQDSLGNLYLVDHRGALYRLVEENND